MWNPFADASEGAVKGFGEAVKDAVSAFKADPTKVVETAAALEQAGMAFQSSVITAVNASMQAEAKSEHWMQWSWRPFGAYVFYYLVINTYILPTYFPSMPVPHVPDNVWLAFLALLGVAAYTRGQAQIETIRASNGNGK